MAKFCAPGYMKDPHTCYSYDALKKISTKYARNTGINIPEKNMSKMGLHSWLESQFAERCTTEYCWLEQPETMDFKLLNEFFRPEFPEGWNNDIHTWLNTDDISNVMKQYEKKFTDFSFIGPVPADCPMKWGCELTNFNPVEAGYMRFGIIFNLDNHDQSGSHWVALWVSLIDKKIEYFDSYGIRPPTLIRLFIDKLVATCNTQDCDVVFLYNRNRYQYGGSECGVFSMYYIIEKLHGKDVINNMPTDELMTRMRKYLYRPSLQNSSVIQQKKQSGGKHKFKGKKHKL